MQVTGRIENWKFTRSISGNIVVVGNIYDDQRKRFLDGEFIHTSFVVGVDGDKVVTKNSLYQLGKELDTFNASS